jgi:hypothetical protein
MGQVRNSFLVFGYRLEDPDLAWSTDLHLITSLESSRLGCQTSDRVLGSLCESCDNIADKLLAARERARVQGKLKVGD